jgi:hypothetical protein
MGASAYRDYAVLGAVAGAVVATVYWVALGGPWWWGALCESIGVSLGAALGAVTGDGSVKEAWAGRVGAFLIPLVALALASLVITLFVGAQGQ